ncbi:17492_t:CDS:1, partial [Funneliformis caledonium]
NSYDRKGVSQMFTSSYNDIATEIDDILNNNMKVINTNSTNAIQSAFFHVIYYQSAYAISKNRIKLAY